MKIVLVGAGSARFTQGLVADLILSPQLGPYDLALVDIDPVALAVAEKLSRKLVERAGADIRITATTNRREALPGARYVITTIGVGGRRAWEQDVFIPRKYGIFQPVGDSVMPGGISRAMRMIPAMIDIARDVQALAPDAYLFNYSNPMTANCWAVHRETGVNIVGLCHGAFRVERNLAALAGVPEDEVTSVAIGLNHLTFFYKLYHHGRDLMPTLHEKAAAMLRDPGNSGTQPFPLAGNNFDDHPMAASPFSWSLFETYGAYPSANDRHVTEFFPERFPGGQYYGRTLGKDAYSLEDAIAIWGDQVYEEMRAQAYGEKPLSDELLRRRVGEHEQLLQIMESLEWDKRDIFYANLPNRGAIPNLPYDAVLEFPCVAMTGGMCAIHYEDFPDALAALLTRKIASIQITVEAALTGSRALFSEALLLDGAVTDRDLADRLRDDLLEAHRSSLPNFFPAG
jgi:alpha-galactosidase